MKTNAVLIRTKDYKMMEWKNGKGKSSEIAISPNHASFSQDPFLWRLSSASVVQDGPFSAFPDYDRFLALIEGKGLKLLFESGEAKDLVRIGDVVRFQGDRAVSCKLESGPITDLNLMFRRARVKANFKTIDVGHKPRSFQIEGQTVLLFAIEGSVQSTVYPGETKFSVKQGDTLRLDLPKASSDEEQLLLLEPGKTGCLIVLIELFILDEPT